MGVKDLQAAALRLSGKERAQLAEALLLSLDESADEQVEEAWLDEAQKRYRAYKAGKTKGRPAEKVFRAARAHLR